MGDRRDRMSPGSGKLLNASDQEVDVAAVIEAVLVGILAGLSASGLYSGTRAIRGE